MQSESDGRQLGWVGSNSKAACSCRAGKVWIWIRISIARSSLLHIFFCLTRQDSILVLGPKTLHRGCISDRNQQAPLPRVAQFQFDPWQHRHERNVLALPVTAGRQAIDGRWSGCWEGGCCCWGRSWARTTIEVAVALLSPCRVGRDTDSASATSLARAASAERRLRKGGKPRRERRAVVL